MKIITDKKTLKTIVNRVATPVHSKKNKTDKINITSEREAIGIFAKIFRKKVIEYSAVPIRVKYSNAKKTIFQTRLFLASLSI